MSAILAQARPEIVDLLNRYCRLLDRGEFDAAGALFSEDGSIDLTGQPVHGPQAIAALLRSRSSVASLHVPSGHVVDVDGERAAHAHSCVHLYRAASPGVPLPLPAALPTAVATYDDTLVHDGQRWFLHSRKASVFMRAP